ncbi:lipocalin family protein [Winogradskyella psychrotolerans]|uniref:lipocalin family protein n=1 Tax=Winogradskyella psychrotolerans TaxID=1344585 RepID=UPI001C072E4F|nr:lipocalin family protein [Winogradskyella psychrotolerans]MBU2930130.1 lipocalin family protein [Winogradskyella psychrotolerans]
MTKIIPLFIFLTLCNNAIGQKRTSVELNINDLIGTWNYTSESRNNNLVLYKISYLKKDYAGGIMKFSSDGKMTKQLSRKPKKCGNDTSSNLNISGNWVFDKKNNILTIKFGKFRSAEYVILELSNNKLILKRIITE